MALTFSAAFVSVSPLKSLSCLPSSRSSVSALRGRRNTSPLVLASARRPQASTSPTGSVSSVLKQLSSLAKENAALVSGAVNNNISATRTAVACFAAFLLATGSPSMSSTPMPVAPVLAEVPQTLPGAALVDEANVVNRSVEDSFEKMAKKIESRTGYKVHFIVVRNLPFGRTAYEYAGDLAEQWKLGDKDVLFVASIKTDRAGAFVGEGVKSVLPDDVARSIAEKTFGKAAGEELYSTAVLDVANRLIPVLNGDADPGAPDDSSKEVSQTYKTKEETKSNRDKYIKIVGGVLVIAIVAPLIQTYWYVRDD